MVPTMMSKPPNKRGMPVWVWAVVGLVVLAVIAGGGFALFGRGAVTASTPTIAPIAAALTQQAITASAPTTAPIAAALTQQAATAALSNKATIVVNLPGSYQDKVGCATQWDAACPATVMTKGDDGKYTLTVKLPAGNYEFKVVEGNNWNVNYGSDGELYGRNYLLKVAADDTVTFVYDAVTHLVKASSKAATLVALPPNAIIAIGYLPYGGNLHSNNRLYSFEVHADGELVLYDNHSNKTMWSSKSKGDPSALVMQDDGNLVLYAKDGSIIWASGKTGKTGDYFLILQDDGNMVVYQGKINAPNTKLIWATNTAQ